MTAVVIDTSALVNVVLGQASTALLDRVGDAELLAPHLLDAELVHVLRRLLLRGAIDEGQAEEAFASADALDVDRFGLELLRRRMLDLRDNLTAYDAAFVTLAEALAVPLVTCDGRLANAPLPAGVTVEHYR